MKKNPKGHGGWLFLYHLTVWFALAASLVNTIWRGYESDPTMWIPAIVFIGSFGALISLTRETLRVRRFNIGYTLAAGALIFNTSVLGALIALGWMIYWIRSKRVLNTFRVGDELTLEGST